MTGTIRLLALFLLLALGLVGRVWAQAEPAPVPTIPGAAPYRFAVLAQDPDGSRLLELGRHEEAVEHFRRALSRDPSSLSANLGLAIALCRLGKVEEAMKQFEVCLARFPQEPEVFMARGLCEQELGEKWLAAAEADYKKVLALAPNHPAAHNQLGLLYQARGDHGAAIPEFRAAIAADPRYFVAYNNLAASLIAAKQYLEAIALLQKAIAMAPDLRGLYLYTNLGIAFLYAGKPLHAEAAFLMETAINPDHLEAHLNLGNLYALSRRYYEAIIEYNRVLIAEPDNRDALVNLGAVYVMIGRPDQALLHLEKAVTLYPDSALAHHYLALAYRALGKLDRANEEDEKAKALGFRADFSPWPPAGPGPSPGHQGGTIP